MKKIILGVGTLALVAFCFSSCPNGSQDMALVYSETFTTAGPWTILDDANTARALVDNTYAITEKQANYTTFSYWLNSDGSHFLIGQTYRLEFQYKPSTVSTVVGSAVVNFDCIRNSSTDYSYKQIDFDGTYFDLNTYTTDGGGTWTKIQGWTQNAAILADDWNTVTIDRTATSIVLTVNGQQCGTWQMDEPATQVGIAIGAGKFTAATSDFTAYFDNLKVYQ